MVATVGRGVQRGDGGTEVRGIAGTAQALAQAVLGDGAMAPNRKPR